MPRQLITATLFMALGFFSMACAAKSQTAANMAAPAQSPTNASGELHYKAPESWVVEHPTSNMRVAQYKLPKVAGDKDDGSLVVYYFGATQGGSVEANTDRWISQMPQPDGSPSKSKAKVETLTVNGLKMTAVDVTGTYTAEMSPGSASHYNESNYRLRAAVIETPKGLYYIKLVGPEKTVGHWDQAFTDYLKSFEFK
jgi:hypothetical protein